MTSLISLRPRIVCKEDTRDLFSRQDPSVPNTCWTRARRHVSNEGGLPPNVLLDMHLCDAQYRNGLRRTTRSDRIVLSTLLHSPLPSSELYATPPKGKRFRRGEAIRDSTTGWLLPWSELTKSVAPSNVIRAKTGLLIRPADIRIETYQGKDCVVVYPELIQPVHPAVSLMEWGVVDKTTGMVLENPNVKNTGAMLDPPEGVKNVDESELRCLLKPHRGAHHSDLLLSLLDDRLKKPLAVCTIMEPIFRDVGSAFLGWTPYHQYVFVDHPDSTFNNSPSYVVFDILDETGNSLVPEEINLTQIRALAREKIPEALKGKLSEAQFAAAQELACALPSVYLSTDAAPI